VDGVCNNANGIDVSAFACGTRCTGNDCGMRRRGGGRSGGSSDDARVRDPDSGGDGECDFTSRNAADLKCRILCEGANGPTTDGRLTTFSRRKEFSCCRISGDAGGVTASYFEWVQDRMGYFWNEAEVNAAAGPDYDRGVPRCAAYAQDA